MRHPDLAVVTGAFGYTGGCVARRLIDQGVRVRTLTRRLARLNSLGGLVEAFRWTSRTQTGCAARCRERASSTTPTGCGTHTDR